MTTLFTVLGIIILIVICIALFREIYWKLKRNNNSRF